MADDTANLLIDWFSAHRRELPWRETTDPYRIWISEVILQQTRVAQGLDYYLRFIDRFPDVQTLAKASEDEVLRHWQGLGYYSRARNLHAAARQVAERFGGIFPDTYEGIRSLKGVGDYTAAAVASFAFGLPHAAVDGNVYRWLSRLYNIDTPIDSGEGKRMFAALAQSLLPEKHAAAFNQAAMEFGALLCTPQSPDCPACPFSCRCLALAAGTVETLPVKKAKSEVKPRWFNYLVIRCGGDILLGQRTEKDIWQNLYEFPLIETGRAVDFSALQTTAEFRRLFDGVDKTVLRDVTPMPRHVLSHRVIHAVFYAFSVSGFSPAMTGKYRIVNPEEIGNFPVSRLVERYLLLS